MQTSGWTSRTCFQCDEGQLICHAPAVSNWCGGNPLAWLGAGFCTGPNPRAKSLGRWHHSGSSKKFTCKLKKGRHSGCLRQMQRGKTPCLIPRLDYTPSAVSSEVGNLLVRKIAVMLEKPLNAFLL